MIPGREEVYSGRLDHGTWEELNKAGMDIETAYIDADVDIHVEYQEDENGDHSRLAAVMEGPETSSLLNPGDTYRPEETYYLSRGELEDVRDALSREKVEFSH